MKLHDETKLLLGLVIIGSILFINIGNYQTRVWDERNYDWIRGTYWDFPEFTVFIIAFISFGLLYCYFTEYEMKIKDASGGKRHK